MKMRLGTPAVLCIVWLVVLPATALVGVAANAQKATPEGWGDRQSPIRITPPGMTVVPAFTDTGELRNAVVFTLKNTTGTDWCKGGVACSGTVDQRWGSLKAYAPDHAAGAERAPEITFNGERYTLKEFHFHSPSEHLVSGRLGEMEIHFVFHKHGTSDCSAGEYLVIGQLIEKSATGNAELEKIFGSEVKLPGPGESVQSAPIIVGRVLHGFPKDTSSYRYSGSLTAPAEIPSCGIPPVGPRMPNQLQTGHLPEVVSWVLLTKPLGMSAAQIGRFEKLFPNGDARSPQKIVSQKVTMGRDSSGTGK